MTPNECPQCGGTGGIDSGGTTPWGSAITLPCPSCNTYPPDWPLIALRIKEKNGWKCERCGHPHDVLTAHVLTVHHLDGNKSNCAEWNLAALCQRCHLTIQGRIKMDQLFFEVLMPVSEWFKPHLEGYRASLKQKELTP